MMPCIPHPRGPRPSEILRRALVFGLAGALAAVSLPARAQKAPADSPVSVPAGALPPVTLPPPAAPPAAPFYPQITPKQASDANDAYLEGLKQIQRKDLAAAVDEFALAAKLNPGDRDYVLALLVARGSRATELVREAAAAEQAGDTAKSDALLTEARKFDPDNPIVAQHFGTTSKPSAFAAPVSADRISASLGGPLQLDAARGTKNFHLQSDPRGVLTRIYQDFGIKATFDSSVQGPQTTLDLNDVTFEQATRIALQATHTFAVPVQPNLVLIVRDTPDNRQEYQPLIEETVYLPGYSQEEMTDLANLARNVFDLKQVTASASDGFMLLRGDEPSLRLVNATFADMLDGGSDVLFDVNLYEVSSSRINNLGAVLPSSVGIFSIIGEADSLLSSNASLLSEAISNGLLVLNGTPIQNIITEIEFLVASGTVSSTEFTNFVGTFGGGLTYAGLYLGSNSSFQLALTATDARLLDAVQIRSGSGTAATFRAGSRYPVITGTYSSGVSSSLASSLSGLNVNGTSVSSLISQYLGGTTATTPEFQFEDLGLTLKMTPAVQHGGDVRVQFDLKLEALGGTSLDNIPILDNRAMTSTITIPPGKTAMLASFVSRNEIRSIDGLPGLSELPGFQGTDQDKEIDTDELLITITPHVVRTGRMHIESKALAAVHTTPAQ